MIASKQQSLPPLPGRLAVVRNRSGVISKVEPSGVHASGIVHLVTIDKDRDVVERACGETDRAASASLPNLRPCEASILGSDIPIPLTLRIGVTATKPRSDGPNHQVILADI